MRSKACWRHPEDSGYMKVPVERCVRVDTSVMTTDDLGYPNNKVECSDSEEEPLFTRT